MNKQRNEDRHQGDRDRRNGEADLAGTLERGRYSFIALLEISVNVLEHDDSVVNDQPDGEGHPINERLSRL